MKILVTYKTKTEFTKWYAEIIAKERGVPLDSVTKKGGNSVLVKGKTK